MPLVPPRPTSTPPSPSLLPGDEDLAAPSHSHPASDAASVHHLRRRPCESPPPLRQFLRATAEEGAAGASVPGDEDLAAPSHSRPASGAAPVHHLRRRPCASPPPLRLLLRATAGEGAVGFCSWNKSPA